MAGVSDFAVSLCLIWLPGLSLSLSHFRVCLYLRLSSLRTDKVVVPFIQLYKVNFAGVGNNNTI